MDPTWIDTYYTALEFFYWEPQFLTSFDTLAPTY